MLLLLALICAVFGLQVCLYPAPGRHVELNVPSSTAGLVLARTNGCAGPCPCPEDPCTTCRDADDEDFENVFCPDVVFGDGDAVAYEMDGGCLRPATFVPDLSGEVQVVETDVRTLRGAQNEMRAQVGGLAATIETCCPAPPPPVTLGAVENHVLVGPLDNSIYNFPVDAHNATLHACGAGGGGGSSYKGRLGEGGRRGRCIKISFEIDEHKRSLRVSLGGTSPGGFSLDDDTGANGADGMDSAVHGANELIVLAQGGRGGMAGLSTVTSATGEGPNGGDASADGGNTSGGGGGLELGGEGTRSGGAGGPGVLEISFQRALPAR